MSDTDEPLGVLPSRQLRDSARAVSKYQTESSGYKRRFLYWIIALKLTALENSLDISFDAYRLERWT